MQAAQGEWQTLRILILMVIILVAEAFLKLAHHSHHNAHPDSRDLMQLEKFPLVCCSGTSQ